MARQRYFKRVVVDAWQWNTNSDPPEWVLALMSRWPNVGGTTTMQSVEGSMRIGMMMANGVVSLKPGDWICQQERNGSIEIWPVSNAAFPEHYEPSAAEIDPAVDVAWDNESVKS